MVVGKEIIIKLYMDGYKACEIALIMNEKKRTVQRLVREYKKILQTNNLKSFENTHIRNKKIRMEENKENKKYMQDVEVALRNPSAYTVNSYGDWILDINKQKYTLDMPMVIKNSQIREYNKTFYLKR